MIFDQIERVSYLPTRIMGLWAVALWLFKLYTGSVTAAQSGLKRRLAKMSMEHCQHTVICYITTLFLEQHFTYDAASTLDYGQQLQTLFIWCRRL